MQTIFTIDPVNSFIQVVPGQIGPSGFPSSGTYVNDNFLVVANGHFSNNNTSLKSQLTGFLKADVVGQSLTFSGGSLIDSLEHPSSPFPPSAQDAQSPGVEDNFGGRIIFDSGFFVVDFGAVVIRDAIADIRSGSVSLGSSSTDFDFELLSAYIDYQLDDGEPAKSLDAASFDYESISTATVNGTGGELTSITVSFELTAPFASLFPNVIDSQLVLTAQIVANLASQPGDFNSDGDVDGRDFLAWQRGLSPTALSASDLAAWQSSYGVNPLIAESVVVPEATSLVLLLGCVAVVLCRQR